MSKYILLMIASGIGGILFLFLSISLTSRENPLPFFENIYLMTCAGFIILMGYSSIKVIKYEMKNNNKNSNKIKE